MLPGRAVHCSSIIHSVWNLQWSRAAGYYATAASAAQAEPAAASASTEPAGTAPAANRRMAVFCFRLGIHWWRVVFSLQKHYSDSYDKFTINFDEYPVIAILITGN